MRFAGLRNSHLASITLVAACLCFLLVSIAGGCAKKVKEAAPADIEKARQDHKQMMQRESGQAPAAN